MEKAVLNLLVTDSLGYIHTPISIFTYVFFENSVNRHLIKS